METRYIPESRMKPVDVDPMVFAHMYSVHLWNLKKSGKAKFKLGSDGWIYGKGVRGDKRRWLHICRATPAKVKVFCNN